MFCNQCGFNNVYGAKFCNSCGTPMPVGVVKQQPIQMQTPSQDFSKQTQSYPAMDFKQFLNQPDSVSICGRIRLLTIMICIIISIHVFSIVDISSIAVDGGYKGNAHQIAIGALIITFLLIILASTIKNKLCEFVSYVTIIFAAYSSFDDATRKFFYSSDHRIMTMLINDLPYLEMVILLLIGISIRQLNKNYIAYNKMSELEQNLTK